MKEFFDNWRRKAGIATLVMALAFMGGWLRSKVVEDGARLSMAGGIDCVVTSFAGKFHIEIYQRRHEWIKQNHWYSEPIGERQAYFAQKGLDWIPPPIPYWQIVTPLTLLSAYLILWKPRKASARAPQSIPGTERGINPEH
jgi:hypothetical protein